MPWRERSAMDQKRLFIRDYLREAFTMAELCRRYGISRPTGYKWVKRFEAEGYAGFRERSRRPKGCSHETAIELTEAILELRRRHPFWGAKKLLTILQKRHPTVEWPARSTVCDLLARHGLVDRKRRRSYPGHPGKTDPSMEHPNDTWCADYKGEFRTGDGTTAIPSRSRTAVPATCSPVADSVPPPIATQNLCSVASSRSSACRRSFDPTMECPSLRLPLVG